MKKIITSIMLSTVVLAQGASLTAVADTTDSQIAEKDSKISSISSQQASAQEQVTAIQGQVSSIEEEQAKLQEENETLTATSATLAEEITELSANIVARDESLKKQARSAQTSGTATSYINTVLNSKSLPDAISQIGRAHV